MKKNRFRVQDNDRLWMEGEGNMVCKAVVSATNVSCPTSGIDCEARLVKSTSCASVLTNNTFQQCHKITQSKAGRLPPLRRLQLP
jgi:hypothetical protein